MNKQEAIKKAYGEYWDKVSHAVDDNGFCRLSLFKDYSAVEKTIRTKIEIDFRTFAIDESDTIYTHLRPKSLQGIEDNRGWIKTKKGEPIQSGIYWIKVKNEDTGITNEFVADFTNSNFEGVIPFGYATHYQPITPPKPPIY